MKIAVVGSINIDQTVISERIPQKGETLFGSSINYIPGGKGANQAVAMAKLGAEVEMFGAIGDDDNGHQMIENLKKNNIESKHIKVAKGVPTGIAIITLGDNDNTIVVVKGANDKVDIEYINSIKDSLLKNDMVVLQHEIPLETVHYIIDLCNENNIPTVLNPAPAADVPKEIVDKVTYLTPNEHEVGLIFGEEIPLETLLKKYPKKLIVTLGAKGVICALDENEIIKVPVRKTTIVDTTGAGDTLNGAFCVRICSGDSIKDALKYANAAASLSIEKLGAQSGMPTMDEVEKALEDM